MKKLTIVFLVYSLLIGLNARANTLCGAADQAVCLENNLVFNLSFDDLPDLGSGSTVVFSLPGVDVGDGLVVSGAAMVPYRLANQGSVTDDQSGIWSSGNLLESDSRGTLALAFELTQGNLSSPVRLSFQSIRVCQQIADGPGPVKLTVSFFAVFAGGKRLVTKRTHEGLGHFDPCPDFAGTLPVQGADTTATTFNPYDTSVTVGFNGQNHLLAPRESLSWQGQAEFINFHCSLQLPVVLWSDTTDINVVSLPTGSHDQFLIPHVARDNNSWRNQWVFSHENDLRLAWQSGALSASSIYSSGAHQLPLEVFNFNQPNWFQLASTQPMNGYFVFARNDDQGGAWVNGWKMPEQTSANVLYLAHVAQDTASFWTGFSLANIHDEPLDVTLLGFDDVGGLLGESNMQLGPSENLIGLVDASLFPPGVAWIEMRADRPMAGVELMGTYNAPHFAGLGLALGGREELRFPLLRSDATYWTGLALLNPSDDVQQVILEFYDASGQLLQQMSKTLAGRAKLLSLAPDGAVSAMVQGDELIGYCLIGSHVGQRLGAYLAQ